MARKGKSNEPEAPAPRRVAHVAVEDLAFVGSLFAVPISHSGHKKTLKAIASCLDAIVEGKSPPTRDAARAAVAVLGSRYGSTYAEKADFVINAYLDALLAPLPEDYQVPEADTNWTWTKKAEPVAA